MNKTFRTAYLSDVIDIIDNPETTSIVCHGKRFDLVRHGHWITAIYPLFTCSECGATYRDIGYDYHFCPSCGVKMDKGEWEEPEINPCRGCIDYDGQGGCKSNGGCGVTDETN